MAYGSTVKWLGGYIEDIKTKVIPESEFLEYGKNA